MENKINVKQKQAYDTEGNWEINNPILLAGQLAYSSDKYGKYKIGDGVSHWNQLEYANDKVFTGTSAEYEEANQSGAIKPGTIVNIIDDNDYYDTILDIELSEESENPVTNKAITKGIKYSDSKDNTVTFTSNDNLDSPKYIDVALLETGEKHSSIFNKISSMFKNIRYLYKLLGTTDISSIGNGTVTDILSLLNENKLNKSNISNSTTVTEAGFAADARQLNAEVAGSYAAGIAGEISGINADLTDIKPVTINGYPYNGITDILKLPVGTYIFRENDIYRKFQNIADDMTGILTVTSIGNGSPFIDTYGYRNYRFVGYQGAIYSRALESGAEPGVVTKDTGWRRHLHNGDLPKPILSKSWSPSATITTDLSSSALALLFTTNDIWVLFSASGCLNRGIKFSNEENQISFEQDGLTMTITIETGNRAWALIPIMGNWKLS